MQIDLVMRDVLRDRIVNGFKNVSINWTREDDLQKSIADVLDQLGVVYKREVRIDRRSRVDFMLEHGVIIEVKTKGSISELTRQLFRYAEQKVVTSLIVVVSKYTLANLPKTMLDKPITTIIISRAFA